MPSTINGVGTWYYGKKNIHEQHAVCEFCQSEGIVQSYDTTLYFVVLFIPLIPLKKLRIISDCPVCKKHRSVSLKEWNECKFRDVDSSMEDLRNFPTNEEKAEKALGIITSYQDYTAFRPAAEIIIKNFPKNPRILMLLGWAFVNFNKYSDAEKAYKKSLNVEDENNTRELLADVLIKQGKTDEAATFLTHIAKHNVKDSVGFLVDLARAYQSQGEHKKALDVFDECVAVYPALETDKFFKKQRKLSQKHLISSKKIKNNVIPVFSKRKKEEKDFVGTMSKFVLPTIILVLAMCYLIACFISDTKTVYLVNGLNKTYKVSLNGQTHTMVPYRKRTVEIPLGKFSFESEDLKVKNTTGEFSLNFFLRPFVDHAYIINPDRTAVFLREKVYYSTSKNNSKSSDYSIYTGESSYDIKGIDFLFQKPPKSITMEKHGVEAKVALTFISDKFSGNESIAYWNSLIKQVGKKKTVELAERILRYQPNSYYSLCYLNYLLKPEDFVKAVKPVLNEKPVSVDVHRFYQDAMKNLGRDKELKKEYASRAQAKNSDSVWLYLYARLVDDKKREVQLLLEGIKRPNLCPYCYHGLAYNAMVKCDYGNACKYWKKALDIEPLNELFSTMYDKALLASGNYNELLKIVQRYLKSHKDDLESIKLEMQILVSQGKEKEAEKKMHKRIADLKRKTGNKEFYDMVKQVYDINWLYCCGRISEYIKAANKIKGNYTHFYAAVSAKDLKKADSFFRKLENPDLKNTLTIYILAMSCQNKKLSEHYRKLAVDLMNKSNYSGKTQKAEIIAGKKKPVWKDIENNNVCTDCKVELNVAIGMMYPDLKKECFQLAEKQNYSRLFPHYFIKDVINKKI